MTTQSQATPTTNTTGTGVGLCLDGKPHAFKRLPPDGKDYNTGSSFYLVERTIQSPVDGKDYIEKFKDYGAKILFCSKCTRKEQI